MSISPLADLYIIVDLQYAAPYNTLSPVLYLSVVIMNYNNNLLQKWMIIIMIFKAAIQIQSKKISLSWGTESLSQSGISSQNTQATEYPYS